MRLTSFTDYSLRVLMYLAVKPEQLATIPEIAKAYAISENHLMKVVHHLAKSGFVTSVRGKGGGIRLARPAEEIRLGTVIRQTEGTAAIVECLGEESRCNLVPACKLKKVLVDAFAVLYKELDRHTLADIVSEPKKLARLIDR